MEKSLNLPEQPVPMRFLLLPQFCLKVTSSQKKHLCAPFFFLFCQTAGVSVRVSLTY